MWVRLSDLCWKVKFYQNITVWILRWCPIKELNFWAFLQNTWTCWKEAKQQQAKGKCACLVITPDNVQIHHQPFKWWSIKFRAFVCAKPALYPLNHKPHLWPLWESTHWPSLVLCPVERGPLSCREGTGEEGFPMEEGQAEACIRRTLWEH